MSLTLPNGMQLAVASTYGAAKTMSALSNAADAVATLESSHGVTTNDILELSSGWPGVNDRIVRASGVATNDVTLEDLDTSSTTKYPAGSGTGSVREITAWTAVTQILGISKTGGDQQFQIFQFLEEEGDERSIPTVRSAQSLTLTLGDDQTLSWYAVLKAASDSREATAFRITLKSGAKIYFNAIVALNEIPSLETNAPMALTCTLSFTAPLTRYAS